MEPAFRDPEPMYSVWIDNLIAAVRTMDAEISASIQKLPC
jgi:hypothetical protein